MGYFPLRHRVQASFAAYSVFYRDMFPPEIKRLEREADQSPPSVAEVKRLWSYTSTPPHVLMAWCLIKLIHGVGLS